MNEESDSVCTGLWSTIEVFCVCADFGYQQYLDIHKRQKVVGAPLHSDAYRKLREVVAIQMEIDFNNEQGMVRGS